MKPIFDLVVTPAVVATIVTFLFSLRAEGLKASREFDTKISEIVRVDVKDAAKLGAEYFATSLGERKATQEAAIILAEREVSYGVSRVLDQVISMEFGEERERCETALLDFSAVLTGGTFQVRSPPLDLIVREPQHILLLANSAAKLRTALTDLRDAELRRGVVGSSLARSWKRIRAFFGAQRGIPSI